MEKPAYTICIGIIWEQLIFVTNSHGDATQFFLNLPFGETMLEQMDGSYNNPYKFNAKELDEDTGLYYYGARYYNPRLSIWYGVDPLAVYNPVMETEFYGDGQHNGGVYFWGNLNPYIYTYQNPIKYIDPNGKQTEGYQSAEAQSLSEIVTIRGQKYHKNTTNLPAKVGNTINSWFGGDSDYFVEKKPYNKVEDKFVHELVDNAAGELVGLKILKYGGKFLLKPLLCFAEGTMISTSTGLKPIESIKEGDLVWSYNETNKESELKKVISLSIRKTSEIISIFVKDEEIKCTKDHPFYSNGNWKEAKDLIEGDKLLTLDGKDMTITSISHTKNLERVYNFEVEGNHNYYVSYQQVLVHNDCFGFKITKAVNSNLPHAVERAVERGIFKTEQEATTALKETSDWITKNKDFPSGSIKDPSYADRVLVPIGNNGKAAYQVGKNGTVKLKTVLNAK